MEEPGFTPITLADLRVVIWGLGLMGGSLAMALKGNCASVAGIDSSPEVVSQAMDRNIISHGSTQPEAILEGADIVILATPVNSILELLETLDGVIKGHAVILDLGSTKRAVLQKMDHLPRHLEPVGGHPMCGKEKGTLVNADPLIFLGAPFALISHHHTTKHAAVVVEAIVRSTGAIPFWIDAETHDRWVASSSHVPFLIANALARSTPLEILPLVGPGFRSTARLAASSSKMMIDVIETNGDNIKQAIERFRECIDRYEYLIERKEWAALELELEHGAEQYQILIGERPK